MSAGATGGPRWAILDSSPDLGSSIKGEAVMRIRTSSYITTLLAAGAAAVAIAAAPTAFAADHQSCNESGSGPSASLAATFRSPPPPQVQFHPYGDQTLLLFHH